MRSEYVYLDASWLDKIQSALRTKIPVNSIRQLNSSKGFNKFSLYAPGQSGEEYLIEIKPRKLNRLDIGSILEQSAAALREKPSARIVLVCDGLNESVRDLLKKAGITIFTFSELNIEKPATQEKQLKSLPNLSPSEQRAYFAILRNGKGLVRTGDLQSLLGIPQYSAKNTLASLSRHGMLYRIGRGKYSVIPADIVYGRKSYTADPLTMLDSLMDGTEYYVAYGSAAHLHGVATQIPLTTFVAVTRQRRQIDIKSARIRFINIKKSHFFGRIRRQQFGSPVFVSDLEKTVIDCFERSDLVGGIDSATRILYDSLEKNLDISKLVTYAKRVETNALVQRLGFTLEKIQGIHSGIPDSILDSLANAVKIKFQYALDPNVRKKGRLSKRWKIYENVNCIGWYNARVQ